MIERGVSHDAFRDLHCPLVMGSLRMEVNTRSERGLCVSVSAFVHVWEY